MGAIHDIVNTVAAVSGTVDAPPLSEVCEKLPSGDVSMQSVTPCVFQKIDVRAPSGTVAGDADISTRAVVGATVGVAVAVPPTGVFTVFVLMVVPAFATGGAIVAGLFPTV